MIVDDNDSSEEYISPRVIYEEEQPVKQQQNRQFEEPQRERGTELRIFEGDFDRQDAQNLELEIRELQEEGFQSYDSTFYEK